MKRFLLPLLTVTILLTSGCARNQIKLTPSGKPFQTYESASIQAEIYSLNVNPENSAISKITQEKEFVALKITNKTNFAYQTQPHAFDKFIDEIQPPTKLANTLRPNAIIWGTAAGAIGGCTLWARTCVAGSIKNVIALWLFPFFVASIALPTALIASSIATSYHIYQNNLVTDFTKQLIDSSQSQTFLAHRTTILFMALHHDTSIIEFDLTNDANETEHCVLR